jgi:hypothetical protein
VPPAEQDWLNEPDGLVTSLAATLPPRVTVRPEAHVPEMTSEFPEDVYGEEAGDVIIGGKIIVEFGTTPEGATPSLVPVQEVTAAIIAAKLAPLSAFKNPFFIYVLRGY